MSCWLTMWVTCDIFASEMLHIQDGEIKNAPNECHLPWVWCCASPGFWPLPIRPWLRLQGPVKEGGTRPFMGQISYWPKMSQECFASTLSESWSQINFHKLPHGLLYQKTIWKETSKGLKVQVIFHEFSFQGKWMLCFFFKSFSAYVLLERAVGVGHSWVISYSHPNWGFKNMWTSKPTRDEFRGPPSIAWRWIQPSCLPRWLPPPGWWNESPQKLGIITHPVRYIGISSNINPCMYPCNEYLSSYLEDHPS